MSTATSTATDPIYVPLLGTILEPGQSIEITPDQAAQFANHPWIKVSPAPATGAVTPQAAPVAPVSANQPPQTAISDETAANESEA